MKAEAIGTAPDHGIARLGENRDDRIWGTAGPIHAMVGSTDWQPETAIFRRYIDDLKDAIPRNFL